VTGRAHEAEDGFAFAGATHRFERGPRGGAREIRDAGVSGCVGIEIFGTTQVREKFRRVRAEDGGVVRGARLGPGDGEFRLGAEFFQRARNARRFLGMTGTRVADASVVSYDFHYSKL